MSSKNIMPSSSIFTLVTVILHSIMYCTFMFSKIAFVEDAKAAFLSAPKREVINLLESTSRACVELSPTACPLQPCPSGSVADKLQLHHSLILFLYPPPPL